MKVAGMVALLIISPPILLGEEKQVNGYVCEEKLTSSSRAAAINNSNRIVVCGEGVSSTLTSSRAT